MFLGGISVSLLDQLVRRGDIPAVRIGARVAFDPRDLLTWADTRKARAPAKMEVANEK
ncbi:MAG: helix-turn-helix domain-containing protein [Phycisphaerae bacterium]|nr:helix-turn-helix domain-containing protein [Phycisphaerae bacterium]